MTHSAWWLVCDAAATYRLAILVTRDSITAGLREWLHRQRIGAVADAMTPPGARSWVRRTWRLRVAIAAHELASCAWCMSMWAGATVTALTVLVPGIWQYPAVVLTLSAGAGFLAEHS